MFTEKKIDKRRKYYLVLDCETATLPFATKYDGNAKQKIAIAKPLIYDLGWQIIDRKGTVYKRKSYLISEIFSVPSVFNTAYYASKRPQYLEKLRNGEIILTDWATATAELEEDLQIVESVGAYNSMFDFKKAIPFTEKYIDNLYSDDYYKWEKKQEWICDRIAEGSMKKNENKFNQYKFNFRNRSYDLFDIWGLACKHILDCDEYRELCEKNEWYSASEKFYKTSAETCFRFYANENDFIESHTAIEDTEIESMIFAEILKRTRNDFEMGIIYFPFRMVGTREV